MKSTFLTIAGIFGATGVALGALGAHFLKEKMKLGLIDPDMYSGFETAAKYQLFHALALLAVYVLNKDKNLKLLTWTGRLFTIGVILFSGSLYLLCTRSLTGLDSLRFLGPVTPIGGLALIGGWICIVIHSIKSGRNLN